jgi:hypothetical protein
MAERSKTEIKRAADRIAQAAGTRIDVLFLILTGLRPEAGLMWEEIHLFFKLRNSEEVCQQWYMPYMVFSGSFRYDPREVSEIYTAWPNRLPESVVSSKKAGKGAPAGKAESQAPG